MAEARDRLSIRGGRRFRPAAIRPLRPHGGPDDGCGLADRRVASRRRSRSGPTKSRFRRRLVARVRLFPGRPLVDRGGLPGRWGQVPLGAPARRAGAAGSIGRLPRLRICARGAPLASGAVAGLRAGVRSRLERVGARAPLHRLSVERPRHGARGQSHPGSDRLRGRPARPHLPRRRHLRRARDAVARPGKAECGRRRRSRRFSRSQQSRPWARSGWPRRRARARRASGCG